MNQNNFTTPFPLPQLPPNLTYSIFPEFAEESPALIIQVIDTAHNTTLLHIGIPFPDLEVIQTLDHASPTDRIQYRPTFLSQTSPYPHPLTHPEALGLKAQVIQETTTPIQRTIDVYNLLPRTS